MRDGFNEHGLVNQYEESSSETGSIAKGIKRTHKDLWDEDVLCSS